MLILSSKGLQAAGLKLLRNSNRPHRNSTAPKTVLVSHLVRVLSPWRGVPAWTTVPMMKSRSAEHDPPQSQRSAFPYRYTQLRLCGSRNPTRPRNLAMRTSCLARDPRWDRNRPEWRHGSRLGMPVRRRRIANCADDFIALDSRHGGVNDAFCRTHAPSLGLLTVTLRPSGISSTANSALRNALRRHQRDSSLSLLSVSPGALRSGRKCGAISACHTHFPITDKKRRYRKVTFDIAAPVRAAKWQRLPFKIRKR